MSDNHVSVPRVQLREWAATLTELAEGDATIDTTTRDQLAAVADQVAYWSTQHTDTPRVRVTQTLGDIAAGSTVVGYDGRRR